MAKRKPTQIDLTTNKLAAALEQSTAPAPAPKKPEAKMQDGKQGKNVVQIAGTKAKKTPKPAAKKPVAKKNAATKKVEKTLKVAKKTLVKKKATKPAAKKVTKKSVAPTKAAAKNNPTSVQSKTAEADNINQAFAAQNKLFKQVTQHNLEQIFQAQELFANNAKMAISAFFPK